MVAQRQASSMPDRCGTRDRTAWLLLLLGLATQANCSKREPRPESPSAGVQAERRTRPDAGPVPTLPLPAPGPESHALLPIGDGEFIAAAAEADPIRIRIRDGEATLLAPGEAKPTPAVGEQPDYGREPFPYLEVGRLRAEGSYPLWALARPRGDGGAPFEAVVLSLAPGQTWISVRRGTGFVPLVSQVPVRAGLKVSWQDSPSGKPSIRLLSFVGESSETKGEVALWLGASGGPDQDWHVFLGNPGHVAHVVARIVSGTLWWLAPGKIPVAHVSEHGGAQPVAPPTHPFRLIDPRGGRPLSLRLGDKEAMVSSDDQRPIARYQVEASSGGCFLAMEKPDPATGPGGSALPARATLILGGPGAGLWDRDANPPIVWALAEPLPEIPAALSGRWQVTRLPDQDATVVLAPRALESSVPGVWIEDASGVSSPAEWVASPAASGPHLLAGGQLWRILRAPDDSWVAVDPRTGIARFLLSRGAWEGSARLARLVAKLCNADALAERIAAHPAEHAFDPRALLEQLATEIEASHGPLRFEADRLLAALETAQANALGEVFRKQTADLGIPTVACPALQRLGKAEARARGGPRLSGPGEEAVALAVWKRLAATGENYKDQLGSLLAARPQLTRPLARAFLRAGEFRCTAEEAREECGTVYPEQIPGTLSDNARFGDPCLHRALALWALADSRLGEADVAGMVDELAAIIDVSEPKDELRQAALRLIGGMPDRVRLPIVRKVSEALSGPDLRGLSDASLRSLFSATHMEAALLALDPEKNRGFLLKAMRSEDAPLSEASLLTLLDRLRAWTGPDVEAALRYLAGEGPCEASMKAALVFADRGDERFLPQPRKPVKDETQARAYWSLCRIAHDPDPVRSLARYLEYLPPRGKVTISESGEGHEGDKRLSFTRAEVTEWNLPAEAFASGCSQDKCEAEANVTVDFSQGKNGLWYLSEIHIEHPYTTC